MDILVFGVVYTGNLDHQEGLQILPCRVMMILWASGVGWETLLLSKDVRRTGNHISLRSTALLFYCSVYCSTVPLLCLLCSGDIALGTKCWEYPHLLLPCCRSQLVTIQLTTFLPLRLIFLIILINFAAVKIQLIFRTCLVCEDLNVLLIIR